MGIRRTPEHVAAMRAGLMASPKSGPYPTHSRAVDWALSAPDGTEYTFRNLAHFVREHSALFPGAAVEHAAARLRRLRPGVPNQASSWRGWRWAGPGEISGSDGSVPIYSLRSPDGVEHHFTNLHQFVMSDAKMFEPDDLLPLGRDSGPCRAEISLGQLRPKVGNRHRSWKGWTWAGGTSR